MSRCVTKPTKWPVRPAKTQISLSIFPVWSESSLSAWRNIGPLTTLHIARLWSDWADAQADLSLRWAHRSFCWFCRVAVHISKFWRANEDLLVTASNQECLCNHLDFLPRRSFDCPCAVEVPTVIVPSIEPSKWDDNTVVLSQVGWQSTSCVTFDWL